MYKWTWQYIRKNNAFLAIGIALLIVENIALIFIYGSQAYIVDDVMIEKNYSLIPKILISFIVAQFLWMGAKLLSGYLLSKVHVRLEQSFSEALIKSFHNKEFSVLESKKLGEIFVYFSEDIRKLSFFLSSSLPKGIQKVITLIILASTVIWINPLLFFWITGVTLIYLLLGRNLLAEYRRVTLILQAKRSDLISHVEENVASVREIISFDKEDWIIKRFLHAFSSYFDSAIKEGKASNKLMGFSHLMRWGMLLGVLVLGVILVMKGALTLGAFIVMYHFSTQLMQTYDEVFQFLMSSSENIAYIERLKREMESDIYIEENTKKIKAPIESIRMENIHFSYSTERAPILNKLNLEFRKGHKIALIGASGCGKSTVTRLILGHYRPNQGETLINNNSLNIINKEDLRSNISVVFQEPYLFTDTIRTNITLGREWVSDHELNEVCRIAQIEEWVNTLPQGIDTFIGDQGSAISGGQRQRIALARAMIGKPEVLILDEATSALDQFTERNLVKQLDEYRKGQITICITHRLSTIQNADLIYVFDGGRVVEKGNHRDLVADSTFYKKLYKVMDKGSEKS